MSKSIRFITRTAVLIALVTLLQWLGRLLGSAIPVLGPTVVTGSFVNMVLVIAVLYVGVWGGVIVGALTPVMAYFIGQMAQPLLIPFVALGNVILVVAVWGALKLLAKQKGKLLGNRAAQTAIGAIVGGVLKFLYMYFFVALVMVKALGLPEKAQAVFQVNFGIVQLWAAYVGGLLAILIDLALIKAIKPLSQIDR